MVVLGRKKKPAPPPPPVLKSASSVQEIEKPSPVVASLPSEPQVVEVHRVESRSIVEKQVSEVVEREPESAKQQPDEIQGRSTETAGFMRRRIFRPFLEYRQLPTFKGNQIKPLTLGQLYRNETRSSSVFHDSETDSDDEVLDTKASNYSRCSCREGYSRSLLSYNNYFRSDENSFEMKLNAHAKAYQNFPITLNIMFDNRIGKFV